MTWFRIDDSFPEHPKVMDIDRAVRLKVVGLWASCGLWSAGQLTDGVFPRTLVEDKGGRPADADLLIRVRLWHPHGHGCPRCPELVASHLVFHDWTDYNPTRERVLAERRATAERVARYRRRNRRGNSEGDA